MEELHLLSGLLAELNCVTSLAMHVLVSEYTILYFFFHSSRKIHIINSSSTMVHVYLKAVRC